MYTDWQLPFRRAISSAFFSTPPETGIVVVRREMPRPQMQEAFTLVYENIPASDLSTLVTIFDGLKGGCLPITLSLPDGNTMGVRLAPGGYSYTVGHGETRTLTLNLVADVRVP